MLFETIDGLEIPKIGFGTYSFGGSMTAANHSHDAEHVCSLRSALDLGYTNFDTAESYGSVHSEELLGRAVRESGIPRESLFITSKISPHHLGYDQVLKSCEASLRRLGMDYMDLYLIHWTRPGMKLPETFRALNKLVADGKVRHLGVSNFDVKLLEQSRKLSETNLLTDQVPYSLGDRDYVKNGVLAYCQSNGVLLTAYTPLDMGRFKSHRAVNAIAAAHSATPQQVALAWLIRQPCVIAIPMSHDPVHQKQNLEACNIQLTELEVAQLA
jgi:diketogulonate reductase-like aldo/keto reductase